MVKKYDIKIAAKKAVSWIIAVVLAGIASMYGDSQLYSTIAPALLIAQNYWKHK